MGKKAIEESRIFLKSVFGPLAAFEPDNPELLFCYIQPKTAILTSLIPKKASRFCRLLTLQTVLSKWLLTSGNTVKFQINHLPKTLHI